MGGLTVKPMSGRIPNSKEDHFMTSLSKMFVVFIHVNETICRVQFMAANSQKDQIKEICSGSKEQEKKNKGKKKTRGKKGFILFLTSEKRLFVIDRLQQD